MNAFEAFPRLAANLYTRPPHYIGETYEGTATLYSVNRDSGTVERANWQELQARFGDDPHVIITRAGHWACGWIDTMRVQPDASDDTKAACEAVLDRLADYPVLNEDTLSQIECDEIGDAIDGWLLGDFQRINGLTDEAMAEHADAIRDALGDAAEHDGEAPRVAEHRHTRIARDIFGAGLTAAQSPDVVRVRYESRGKAGTNGRKAYPLDGNWHWFGAYERRFVRSDTGAVTAWHDSEHAAEQEARRLWGGQLFKEN